MSFSQQTLNQLLLQYHQLGPGPRHGGRDCSHCPEEFPLTEPVCVALFTAMLGSHQTSSRQGLHMTHHNNNYINMRPATAEPTRSTCHYPLLPPLLHPTEAGLNQNEGASTASTTVSHQPLRLARQPDCSRTAGTSAGKRRKV